jgi:hypothetical protein
MTPVFGNLLVAFCNSLTILSQPALRSRNHKWSGINKFLLSSVFFVFASYECQYLTLILVPVPLQWNCTLFYTMPSWFPTTATSSTNCGWSSYRIRLWVSIRTCLHTCRLYADVRLNLKPFCFYGCCFKASFCDGASAFLCVAFFFRTPRCCCVVFFFRASSHFCVALLHCVLLQVLR